jgi:hypothetical protein
MEIGAILALISALPLLLQLITSIVVGIQNATAQAQANGAVSAPVAGPVKLDAALGLFQALWPAISSTGTGAKLAAATTPDQLTATVTSLINGVVEMSKTLGIENFVKSLSAPAVPTA